MALEKLLVGKFYVYVASAGQAHDASLNPEAPWELLGSGWNKKGEGVKMKVGRTFHDIEIENELEPIDSLVEKIEQMLTLNLLDWSAEALAYALHGGQTLQTSTAAASDVPGSKDVGLEYGIDTDKLAVTVVGPSPYVAAAGAYQSNIYYPLMRIDGDWETDFMLATEAPNPITFKKLKHATLNAKILLQNADAL